jgi:hypothetical protein
MTESGGIPARIEAELVYLGLLELVRDFLPEEWKQRAISVCRPCDCGYPIRKPGALLGRMITLGTMTCIASSSLL